MNPPPIQWMPVFEAAAKYKNFRKAAEQLNVSPPAISQQIKALENYLGMALFRRNGPRLHLTEAGEFYYQIATKVVAEHCQGFNEFDQRFNKRSLRLNTPLFIAQELLIPSYMGYKELQPNTELRITTGTDYIDFDSGTADAAIRFGMNDWPNLDTKLLCSVEISPVCSASYYQKYCSEAGTSKAALLHNQILITTNENSNDWKYLFPDIQPKETIICDSYFSAIKSAEKGLGIVLGIFPAINCWVNERRLQLLKNKFLNTQAAYWLVYPKQHEDNELLDACYKWSKELFDALPKLS